MHQQVDAHSPIPIRWQLTELRKDVSEGGSVPRNQALPSPRKLVGFLGIPSECACTSIEELKRRGYRPLSP